MTPTNKIGSTAWHQQRRALDQDNRSHVHPREAFMQDLTGFIQSLQQEKHDVIVGGNWKDYLDAPNSSLLRLYTTLNLVDPWLHFYPGQSPATHERGQNRIDSVFISHNLLPTVESIGYSPVGTLATSDHRAISLHSQPANSSDRKYTPTIRQVAMSDQTTNTVSQHSSNICMPTCSKITHSNVPKIGQGRNRVNTPVL
jgi:hypothetical protein